MNNEINTPNVSVFDHLDARSHDYNAVLAALKANNGMAIDDHLAHLSKLEDKQVKVQVIGSLNHEAVFLEEFTGMTTSYSVNRMKVDLDGVVHITKNSVAVLNSKGRTLAETVTQHNITSPEERHITNLHFMAKNLAVFAMANYSVSMDYEKDGSYAVSVINKNPGVEMMSTSNHWDKFNAVNEFKRVVQEIIGKTSANDVI